MDIHLDFARNETCECGAALLSILACPGPANDDKRAELHLSLCGKAIWIKYLLAPDDWTPVPVKLPYVFRDAKRVDRDVRFVARRISERMIAGRMAIPFLWRAELGDEFMLPRGIERLSVNQMAEYVLDDAGQADPGNVEKRLWAPSRPVIHLAAAAALVAQELKRAWGVLRLELFLVNRDLIETVVRRAEAIEALIANGQRFPVKPEQLIHVRIA